MALSGLLCALVGLYPFGHSRQARGASLCIGAVGCTPDPSNLATFLGSSSSQRVSPAMPINWLEAAAAASLPPHP